MAGSGMIPTGRHADHEIADHTLYRSLADALRFVRDGLGLPYDVKSGLPLAWWILRDRHHGRVVIIDNPGVPLVDDHERDTIREPIRARYVIEPITIEPRGTTRTSFPEMDRAVLAAKEDGFAGTTREAD